MPSDVRIRAKVYPVIKPLANSFVFETDKDPAIFRYLDPTVPAAKLENTVAHELHHVGYGGSSANKKMRHQRAQLPEKVQTAREWTGAFGEGFAMLAASGGPDVHPHAVSAPSERERWYHDPAMLLESFNSAAAEQNRNGLSPLALWSPELITALRGH